MNKPNYDIDINVNTEQIETATDKAQELADTLDEITPKLVIRNSTNCVFNINITN